jgi:hypothetical protein
MMADQPRIVLQYISKEIEPLCLDFLSMPEAEIDTIVVTIGNWVEQINRKHRESKRYRQIVKKVQSPKRVEKDYRYLFQLRYNKDIEFQDQDDTDIQNFIQALPIGGFLQAIFRLSLNDLRGIRFCYFPDLTQLLVPIPIHANQRHLRALQNLPQYQQFLLELPTPFDPTSALHSPGLSSQPEAPSYPPIITSSASHPSAPSGQSELESYSPVTSSGATDTPLVKLAKRQRFENSKQSFLKISNIVNDSTASQPRDPSNRIYTVIHQGIFLSIHVLSTKS